MAGFGGTVAVWGLVLICVVLPGVQLQFTVPLSGGKLGLCHYDYNRVTLSLLTIQIIALHCYTLHGTIGMCHEM